MHSISVVKDGEYKKMLLLPNYMNVFLRELLVDAKMVVCYFASFLYGPDLLLKTKFVNFVSKANVKNICELLSGRLYNEPQEREELLHKSQESGDRVANRGKDVVLS